MRILLFHSSDDKLLGQYVRMAQESLQAQAEVAMATDLGQLRWQLEHFHPDVLHLFGAWQWKNALAWLLARRKKVRVVCTPYGQLEPWVVRTNYWREKLPKTLLFQRWLTRRMVALIAMGKMEKESLEKMGWNRRIEVVYNPLVTSTIQPEEMARQLAAIYRKVLDSHLTERMLPSTCEALTTLLHAGTAGDVHWITDEEQENCQQLTTDEWEKLLLYSQQEHVYGTVCRGITLLELEVPEISIEQRPCYYPANWKDEEPKIPLSLHDKELTQQLKTILQLASKRRLTLRALADLSIAFRQSRLTEDLIQQQLREAQIDRQTAALMAALQAMTGLEEGLMPIPPLKGKLTNRIIRTIKNHLAI